MTEQEEREHCERVAREQAGGSVEWAATLLSERAAVRAECRAEIDRLTARVEELELKYEHWVEQ